MKVLRYFRGAKKRSGHSINCKQAVQDNKQRNTHNHDHDVLVLSHGVDSILGSIVTVHGVLGVSFPFNLDGAPWLNQLFNIGQKNNFYGLSHSILHWLFLPWHRCLIQFIVTNSYIVSICLELAWIGKVILSSPKCYEHNK